MMLSTPYSREIQKSGHHCPGGNGSSDDNLLSWEYRLPQRNGEVIAPDSPRVHPNRSSFQMRENGKGGCHEDATLLIFEYQSGDHLPGLRISKLLSPFLRPDLSVIYRDNRLL